MLFNKQNKVKSGYLLVFHAPNRTVRFRTTSLEQSGTINTEDSPH